MGLQHLAVPKSKSVDPPPPLPPPKQQQQQNETEIKASHGSYEENSESERKMFPMAKTGTIWAIKNDSSGF